MSKPWLVELCCRLMYTDEEVERCFEEFYEDVHTEFLKFGEIVNFKVCKNGSFHLRGNVYVQYRFLDSALLAYNSVNGRYFAGKQVTCNFVSLTRWKVAICGEYMKTGFKTCSHGTACNFIHCFRNPGGDYEWADSDRPPPKYWVQSMAALFGYSDDYEASQERENLSVLKNTSEMSKTDSDRYRSNRSRSKEMDQLNTYSGRRKHGDKRKQRTPDEEWNANLKDNHKMKRKTPVTDSNREWLEKEENKENHHKRARKSSLNGNKDDSSRSHDEDFDMDWTATARDDGIEHGREPRNSRKRNRERRDWIHEADLDGDRDRKRHHVSRRKSSRHQSRDNRAGEAESNKKLLNRGDLETHDISRKSLRRRRSGLQDDNKDYENDEVDGGWPERNSDGHERHHKKKSSKHHKKLDSTNGDI